MDDFVLNLTKKLGKPELVDIFNAQVESIKDGRNNVFDNEDEFLKWFIVNVLRPERQAYLQNLLKKSFNENRIIPEVESQLTNDSLVLFEKIKNNCDKETVKDFIKIINTFYIKDRYEIEYETALPYYELTKEDINKNFKRFADMLHEFKRSDDFNEVVDWINDFVYYQGFESKVPTQEDKEELNVIKSTLRNAIEIKSFLPEIIDMLDDESINLFNQLKETHAEEEIENIYKVINSAYILDYFSNKYEDNTQNHTLTPEDINLYFRDMMKLFSQRSYGDLEFDEIIKWVDDFVYNNSDGFLF